MDTGRHPNSSGEAKGGPAYLRFPWSAVHRVVAAYTHGHLVTRHKGLGNRCSWWVLGRGVRVWGGVRGLRDAVYWVGRTGERG